jgi:predicted Ser/Thr protein kinase
MVADRQIVPHAHAEPPAPATAHRRRPKVLHGTLDPTARPAGLPAPWDALAWRQLAPFRNRSKARLFVAEQQGRLVVCKDCSLAARVPLAGSFRRWTLRNEARVLRALDGLPGVPRLLAAWRTGLVMEHVPGRLLTELRGTTVPGAVFDRLDALLAAIHARGVAIGDLHRRNILVDEQGAVGIIDFEIAFDERRGLRRWLTRRARHLDRFAAARQRQAFGVALGPEHEALLASPPAWYRVGRRLKRWFKMRRR